MTGRKDFACAGHEEPFKITISQRRDEAAIGSLKGAERTIPHQEVKDATAAVHDRVKNTAFGLVIVNIDHRGVVVGVEHEKLIVYGEVKQARFRVDGLTANFKIKRRERHQRIGWRERLNDHLGDFGVRWQIPTCS